MAAGLALAAGDGRPRSRAQAAATVPAAAARRARRRTAAIVRAPDRPDPGPSVASGGAVPPLCPWRPTAYVRRVAAPRAERARAEDGFIFVVLVLTLLFLMFMASVPIWFTGFVRALGG